MNMTLHSSFHHSYKQWITYIYPLKFTDEYSTDDSRDSETETDQDDSGGTLPPYNPNSTCTVSCHSSPL